MGISEPERFVQVAESPSSRGLGSAGSSPSAGSPGKGVEDTYASAASSAKISDERSVVRSDDASSHLPVLSSR